MLMSNVSIYLLIVECNFSFFPQNLTFLNTFLVFLMIAIRFDLSRYIWWLLYNNKNFCKLRSRCYRLRRKREWYKKLQDFVLNMDTLRRTAKHNCTVLPTSVFRYHFLRKNQNVTISCCKFQMECKVNETATSTKCLSRRLPTNEGLNKNNLVNCYRKKEDCEVT